MKAKFALGIDPSLSATGWALLDLQNMTVITKGHGPLLEVVEQIGPQIIAYSHDGLRIGVERFSGRRATAKMAKTQAAARATTNYCKEVMRRTLDRVQVPYVHELDPMGWRQVTHGVCASNVPGMAKETALQYAKHGFKFKGDVQALTHDEAEAVCIAYAVARLNGDVI